MRTQRHDRGEAIPPATLDELDGRTISGGRFAMRKEKSPPFASGLALKAQPVASAERARNLLLNVSGLVMEGAKEALEQAAREHG